MRCRACRRVVLVTGTSTWDSRLEPSRPPARESDPRHVPPDYYFDQIDWLTSFQRGESWDWVELRPQTLCGFATGTPISLAPAIAVYAAVSEELGLPVALPRQAGRVRRSTRSPRSTRFANAALWAAKPHCGAKR